jgi:hypothetical protein
MPKTCSDAPSVVCGGPKEKPPLRRLLNAIIFQRRVLFQRSVDGIELRVQVAPQAVDHNNDRDGNAGCDQAIFNGGSTTLVSKEPCNHLLHCSLFILDKRQSARRMGLES